MAATKGDQAAPGTLSSLKLFYWREMVTPSLCGFETKRTSHTHVTKKFMSRLSFRHGCIQELTVLGIYLSEEEKKGEERERGREEEPCPLQMRPVIFTPRESQRSGR